jgi:hypothetical protein
MLIVFAPLFPYPLLLRSVIPCASRLKWPSSQLCPDRGMKNLGGLAPFENGRASRASGMKLQHQGQNTYHHQRQLYSL